MTNSDAPEIKITDTLLGTGVEATKGALVFIQYEGFLENGTPFDSTAKHGKAYQFVVGSTKVIKGMSLGLLGMREHGRRTILIPAALAYGERQVGPLIMPHSNLIFHIELLEAHPRE
jgi:FKBP-type peptidyl-prolyl cis-trans isomerase